MNCLYCHNKLKKSDYYPKTTYECFHNPVSVSYYSLEDEVLRSINFYLPIDQKSGYRLLLDQKLNNTQFALYRKGIGYNVILEFPYLLDIIPEQFPNKLKTWLTFL